MAFAVFCFANRRPYAQIKATIEMTWKGESDVAPSSSTVYLQIWNRIFERWDTIDSDNTTGADTEFTLTGSVTSGLGDYYDDDGWYECRVYQETV